MSRIATRRTFRPAAAASRRVAIHASGEFQATWMCPAQVRLDLPLVVRVQDVVERAGRGARSTSLEAFPDRDDLRVVGDGAEQERL